jgi:hypothetical protein
MFGPLKKLFLIKKPELNPVVEMIRPEKHGNEY